MSPAGVDDAVTIDVRGEDEAHAAASAVRAGGVNNTSATPDAG